MAEGDADIALIGLAVMGQNLILNMNDHGFKVRLFQEMAGFILALQVVAYNRTTSKVDDFLNNEVSRTLSTRFIRKLKSLHKRMENI